MGWGVCGEGDALEQRDGLLRLLQRLVDAAELRGGKLAIAVDVKPRYFALEAEFGGGRRRHVEVLWSSRGTEEPFRVACQAMRESEVDVNVLQARKLLSNTPNGRKADGIGSISCSQKALQPNLCSALSVAGRSAGARVPGAAREQSRGELRLARSFSYFLDLGQFFPRSASGWVGGWVGGRARKGRCVGGRAGGRAERGRGAHLVRAVRWLGFWKFSFFCFWGLFQGQAFIRPILT